MKTGIMCFFLSLACENLLHMHTPAEILKGGVCLHPQKDYFGRLCSFPQHRFGRLCVVETAAFTCAFYDVQPSNAKDGAITEDQPYFGSKMIYQQLSAQFGVSVRGNLASSPPAMTLARKTSLFRSLRVSSHSVFTLWPKVVPRVMLS